MKGLLELKKTEANRLFKELHSNASVLIETGQFAAQKENFGVAVSLSILGVEEFVKSIVIYLHSSGINIFKIKELQHIFHKHKRKHEFAILLEVLVIIEAFFPNENKQKTVKNRDSRRIKSTDKVIIFFDQVLEVLEPVIKLNEHIEWWDRADNMKNMGFYVDFRNESVKSPTRISKQEYDKAIHIADELRNRFRVLKIMFERYYLDNSQIVRQINEGIDLLNKNSSKS